MTKKKAPKEPKKMGRPTAYTPELAEEICEVIASSELGLLHLCNARPHWPDRATIFTWRRKYADFRDKYTLAKEDQTEVCVEYMQEVMNEPHKYVDEETGYTKIDVPMLRLKMDTMKWQAGKLKPKKFGEKVETITSENDLLEDSLKRKNDLDEQNKKEF